MTDESVKRLQKRVYETTDVAVLLEEFPDIRL